MLDPCTGPGAILPRPGPGSCALVGGAELPAPRRAQIHRYLAQEALFRSTRFGCGRRVADGAVAYDFIYAMRDMVEKSPGDVSPGEEYALVFRQGSLRPLTRIRLGRPDISGTSGEAVLMATPAGPHALVVEGSTGSPQFEVRLVGLAKGGTAVKLAQLKDDLTDGYYQPPGRPDEEGCQTHAQVRGSFLDLIVCLRASDCGAGEMNDFTVRAYAIRGVRFVRVFRR